MSESLLSTQGLMKRFGGLVASLGARPPPARPSDMPPGLVQDIKRIATPFAA